MNTSTPLGLCLPKVGQGIAASLTIIILLVAFGISHATDEGGISKISSSPARGTLPADITSATIEDGRKIFHGLGNCYQCHGKNGAGTFRAPALNDAEHIHLTTASFAEIEARIRAGVPKPKHYFFAMPPLGGANLSDEALRAVAAYVFTIDQSR